MTSARAFGPRLLSRLENQFTTNGARPTKHTCTAISKSSRYQSKLVFNLPLILLTSPQTYENHGESNVTILVKLEACMR